jgi:hypothetical protein
MSDVLRLRGTAARAEGPDQPLGPGVTVPEEVSVTIEFSRDHTVGTAALWRDEAGDIQADVMVFLDGNPLLRKGMQGRRLWPYFALGIGQTVISKDDAHPMGVIRAGAVRELALVTRNSDPGLPPYKIVQ